MMAAAAAVSAGCLPEKTELISLGDWISLISEKAGIFRSGTASPYYINIPENSEYYEIVQAAVEWEVLEPSVPFDPEVPLTREWTAYTLMNLAGKKENRCEMITDLSSSMFSGQVSAAVSSGLMKVDGRGKFYPKKRIGKAEAEELLAKTIDFINNRDIPEITEEYDLKKDQNIVKESPLYFDEEGMTASFPAASEIQEGDLISWTDENGMERVYRAESVSAGDEYLTAELAEADYGEITEKTVIGGTETIDFSSAVIIGEDGRESSFRPEGGHALMTVRPMTKTINVSGYQVTFTAAGFSLKAEAQKTLPSGAEVTAGLSVDNVRVDYQWKYDEDHIRDGYFKVTFGSYEHAGLRRSVSEKRFADFAGIEPENFIGSLKAGLKKKNDVLEDTLTLCTVKVPVSGSGAVNLKMKLQLNLYVSGQAELLLTQDNVLGCEIRNHSMRLIKDQKKEADGSIAADLRTTAGIYFGLCLADFTLMDAKLNIGTKASVETTVHMYDEEGNHTVVTENIPLDAADEAARDNPDVLVCGDLRAGWIADAFLNSSSSAAGKLGISGEIVLADGSQPLFPGFGLHMESLRLVKKCTRGERPKIRKKGSSVSTGRISIEKYSLIIQNGESRKIKVESLPEGYMFRDLVFTSNDRTIAEADPDGTVYAVGPGSTSVTVATSDGKYKIRCSIIVPKVSTE